ncbi:MAG: ABC transporter ATP-binding protein [archaeon]|jgi:ATP-binding cassette subfamily B protein
MSGEEEKVNYADNLRYYFTIAKPYWAYFVVVLVCIFAQTFMEVGQNYLFKLLVDSGGEFFAGNLLKEAFISLILFLAGVYFVSMLIQGFAKYYRMLWLNTFEVKMMFDVKKDIYDHLIGLSHNFHSTHRTGSLISKLNRSGKSIESLTDFITFQGSPLIIKVLVSFVAIAFFDLTSALIVLLACIVYILFSLYVLGIQQKVNVERNNAEDYEKGFISDTFTNIETIKNFGKEKRMGGIFSSIANKTLVKQLEFWNYYAWVDLGFVLIFGLGTLGLMYFTLSRTLLGEINVGSLVFIYASYSTLIMPLYEFMWGIRRSYEAMSDMQGIVEYKKISQEVADAKNANNLQIKHGEIEFKNVTFTYGRKDVIKDFNLKVKPKEKVALVGHSGAGKTTIVKLLYRLYDVKDGAVLVDGKDVRSVTQESLRQELSIVPQECVLFNDSIYNNVLFSSPNATRENVFRALKIAKLYDFVMDLPEKENTIVGERGIKLSGGEKQRLSIARAVLADKKILVLDEATSSLDSSTERAIQQELFDLMKGKTTIIIAHRLSTIMQADKIVVLEKGRIVEVGTHEELSNKKGIYKKLWELQKQKAIK